MEDMCIVTIQKQIVWKLSFDDKSYKTLTRI